MINNTTNTSLSCIEINPKTQATASVIWLHGLGADGNDFAPIVPELHLPETLAVRFIFPNAPEIPVTINNGYVMRAWYDIVSMSIDQRTDEKGVFCSVAALTDLIEKEIDRGIPADKIILAGFSQGAVIALTTGLLYPKRLGGIMGLSGYLPHADKIFAEASQANQSVPIFLAHGTQDPVVPFMLGQMACDLLTKHHYQVSWHRYMMPHSVCGEEIKDISEWIESCLR